MGVGESDGEGKGEGESEGMALGVALAVACAVSPDLTAISRPAATIVTTATAQTTTTTILFPAVARAINGRMRSITGSSPLGTKPAHRIAGIKVLVLSRDATRAS